MEYMSELSRTMALIYTATPVSPFKTLATLKLRFAHVIYACDAFFVLRDARDTDLQLDYASYNTTPRS